MKRFIDKKYTVNVGTVIASIIGILFGILTTAVGITASYISVPYMEIYSNGGGTSSIAAFGADFYTYIYSATRQITINTNNIAESVQTVNDNINRMIDYQCRLINTIGIITAVMGVVIILIFVCILCNAIKINPCCVYDESKDKSQISYIDHRQEPVEIKESMTRKEANVALETLESMRQSGVISYEDYSARKEDILSKLEIKM